MATSSPFTHGGNFLSAVQGSVDPRTGIFSFNFALAQLCANNTLGPQLPLSLNYSPLTAGSPSGLGNGVTPGLTRFDDRNGKQLLQLSTGEQYKTAYNGSGDLILRQHKLDTVRLALINKDKGEAAKKIHVTYKSGERETLAMVGGQGVYLPVRLETPLGHAVTLNWDKAFRLSTVIDERGGRAICTLAYPVTGVVNISLWPDSSEAARITLRSQNDYLSSVTHHCPDGDLVWHLSYDEDATHRFNGMRPLVSIASPTGLSENVVYEGGKMRFRTQTGEGSLPAVVRHTLIPGAGQPPLTTTYDYSSSNYMGYGAQIQTPDPDSDNLYNVLSLYDYWSRQTLVGSDADQIPDRTTERHYNNFHLLVSEKETVAGTTLSTLRETVYGAVPGKQFIDQPVTFQMPMTQTVTWSDGRNHRQEITRCQYDDVHGNLTSQTAPDGTLTTCEYYPAAGAGKDCPAEPNGFTRFMKRRTVTPAPGPFKDVPVTQESWYYSAFPVCRGSTLSGAVVQTAVVYQIDGQTHHTETYEYVSQPAGYEHGRMKKKTATVWGQGNARYNTVQTLTFYTGAAGLLTQSVQTVVDEYPGQFPTRTLTLTHQHTQSSLTGRLQKETDVAGNSVSYQYDVLGRLLLRTNHSDKQPYTSTERYSYTLPDATQQRPAQTTHTDIRGNRTRTSHDGLGRIFRAEVFDPDGALGWRTVAVHAYDVQGNNHHSTALDTLRDGGANAGELTQTLLRVRDHWGLMTTETGKEDGVTAHRVVDPVGKVWPDKKALGQLTTQEVWHSARSDARLTAKTRVYYDATHRPVVSETYAVTPDGKGWEDAPYATTSQTWDTGHRLRVSTDALGRRTTFQYDVIGRPVATTYADGSVVKKAYAPFSLGTLATHISLTDPQGKTIALGHQAFDGLGRLVSTTSGGRTTRMTYATAWQQHPSGITGPDGAVQTVRTDAALGEAPVDIRARGNAADVHQTFTYDLPTAMLKTATENKTTISLTAWPSGRLETESTVIANDAGQQAKWQYSLGGLPQTYTDVGGIKETRTWQPAGLLASITDPTVRIVLTYDSLTRLTSWVATEKTGARLRTTLAFDPLGREGSRTLDYQDNRGKTVSTQQLSQQWSVTGQLEHRALLINGQLTRDEMFTYDTRNRLVLYRCGGTDLPVDAYGNAFTRQTFAFDALGNIVTCQTTLASGETDTARYYFDNQADPCQLTRVTHSLWDKKYHYPVKISLEYDKAGRMIKDEAGRTLSYDALGRLSAVKGGGTYGYDAHNRMVFQKVDKTEQAHRLYYRANRLIGEWLTKGDGRQPKPDDKQVRLVYAAGACAAQENTVSGHTTTLLTGTDGKASVIATAQEDSVKTTTYTPYGYTPNTDPLALTGTPAEVAGSTFFELEFTDSTVTRTATIYSNGQNQVAVSVRTVLQDSNGKVVHLSAGQLWACLTLKTTRGEEIKKQPLDKGYAHLSVWNMAGDFAHAIRYGSALPQKTVQGDDYSQVVVYLSTAEMNGAYEIYAELKFNANFSETTQGGEGEGHFLSHLNINTVPAIDYGQSQNWRLDTSSQWVTQGDVDVEEQQLGEWTYLMKAESRYRQVRIVNVNAQQGSPLKLFSRSISGTTFDTHSYAGAFSHGNISADIGWGLYTPHYDKMTWWVEPALAGGAPPDVGYHADSADNYYFLWQESAGMDFSYRVVLKGAGVHKTVDKMSDTAITLYQWDMRVALPSCSPWGWSDLVYPSTVSVTDTYGNSGTFTITFPTDAWDPVLTFGPHHALRIVMNSERDTLRQQTAALSGHERQALLQKAGAFHLADGHARVRPGDSESARALRTTFGDKAIPTASDFAALIDFLSPAADVLPHAGAATTGGLGLATPGGTLAVQTGRGFSTSGGKLAFDVAAYLNG